MPEFRLETALRRRKCHNCTNIIQVGEEHLAASNAYSNRRGNMCYECMQRTASLMLNHKLIALGASRCQKNRPKISDTLTAGKACQKKSKTVAS